MRCVCESVGLRPAGLDLAVWCVRTVRAGCGGGADPLCVHRLWGRDVSRIELVAGVRAWGG